jgi:hypothetical protein
VILIQSLDAPKSILETKKNPKTLSSGQKKTQKTQKNPKNPKKPKKNQKNHWAGFFLKKPGFFPTLADSGENMEMGLSECL